jgi:protein-tyrosine phosphatase
MIDLHSHVLPGLDDGARDEEEALAIGRAAAADGTRVLAATPHVREDYPTTADAMEGALGRLREAFAEQGIELTLLPGGEVALEEARGRPVEELRRFGLGGNPRYLLVETPYLAWPASFDVVLGRLVACDITPVIAHPERNADVQQRPELLARAVEAGALVQVTAASLDGSLGGTARRCARRLLGLELVHLIASDAHAPQVRSTGMSAAFRAVGDERLARWLTSGVPGAIVNDAPLPRRPQRSRSVLARLRGR